MAAPVTNEALQRDVATCQESIGKLASEVARCQTSITTLEHRHNEAVTKHTEMLGQVLQSQLATQQAQVATQQAAEKVTSAYTANLEKRASLNDEQEVARDALALEQDKGLVIVNIDAAKERAKIKLEEERLSLEAKRVELEAKRERSGQVNKLIAAAVGITMLAVTALVTHFLTRAGVAVPAATPALEQPSPSSD